MAPLREDLMSLTDSGTTTPAPNTGAASALPIRTARLVLVPATVASLTAELDGNDSFARHMAVSVPDGWPPELYDKAAIRYTADRLADAPAEAGWWLYYVTTAAEPASLVGVVGYKGPPTADGIAEIGYGVLEEHRRKGYATEASRALIERAFGFAAVRVVAAETYPHLIPSIGVMEKCGLGFAGDGSEDGVIRYEITREAWQDRSPVEAPA
jgi:RimJ/RimL family protein N-acetyltransferase